MFADLYNIMAALPANNHVIVLFRATLGWYPRNYLAESIFWF